MTQKESNANVMWAIAVATIILMIGMYVSVQSYPESQEPATANEIAVELVGMVNIPTAEDIANAVNVPSANNDMMNKLCELTKGCEFWELKNFNNLFNLYDLDVDEAEDDFRDALDDFYNIDDDYETLDFDYDMKDYQIRVSEGDSLAEAKKDGNWVVQVFFRLDYTVTDNDVDEDDEKGGVDYFVLTSTLDEGEYDELSIKKVSRNFEFQ